MLDLGHIGEATLGTETIYHQYQAWDHLAKRCPEACYHLLVGYKAQKVKGGLWGYMSWMRQVVSESGVHQANLCRGALMAGKMALTHQPCGWSI